MNRALTFVCLGIAAAGLGLGAIGCTGNGKMKSDVSVTPKGTTDDASSSDVKAHPIMNNAPSGDIIAVATGPGMQDVSTLVTALKAADLVDDLQAPGPFTVFAPTNEAFAKLPKGKLDDLLKPENKEELRKILLYHVHQGDAIMASDTKTMQLSTLDGKPLHVKVNGATVTVDNAKIVKKDVKATNGVIHWIDRVLMPPM